MGFKVDETGNSYGLYTVLRYAGRTGYWECKCKCGTVKVVRIRSLRSGVTQSCGCLNREIVRKKSTKHGLCTTHKRLYESVKTHFGAIRKGHKGYKDTVLDPRYTNDAVGVAKFCNDLLEQQPDQCALYESDISLDLDKDNNYHGVFCPECIRFADASTNRSKQSTNVRLSDGSRLVDICKRAGVVTTKNNHATKQYRKYYKFFCKSNGEGHPELVQKANELICLYTKTLKMVKLLEDARQFASAADVQKLLQTSNPESV